MSNYDYLKLTQSLPLPTKQQFINFAHHVCDSHSWYKHLSITKGAEFIFFLSPYAGKGPEGSERLHYSWKSTSEYRERFGFLEYVYKASSTSMYSWDSIGVPISTSEMVEMLPSEIMVNCSCILYPYVSKYMNAPSCCYSVSDRTERFAKLENGSRQHPNRELILAWKKSVDTAPERLSEYKKDVEHLNDIRSKLLRILLGNGGCFVRKKERPTINIPPKIERYYQAFCQEFDLYMDLQEIEYQKITKCLQNLFAIHSKNMSRDI